MGKTNILEKAKKIGLWIGMDKKKSCQEIPCVPIKKHYQGQKPSKQCTHENIALEIFGPLPVTEKEYKYLLSILDRLTKYTVFIPLPNETTSIVEALIEHYIYTSARPRLY